MLDYYGFKIMYLILGILWTQWNLWMTQSLGMGKSLSTACLANLGKQTLLTH